MKIKHIGGIEYQQAMYQMSRTELAGDSSETYGYMDISVFRHRYYLMNNKLAHPTIAQLTFLGLVIAGIFFICLVNIYEYD